MTVIIHYFRRDAVDYILGVPTEVVVLNGGSSAGKSTIAGCLRALLNDTWLVLGVDDLIVAMGSAATGTESAIIFNPDGTIATDQRFRKAEDSWYQGLAAIARAGTGIIIVDVFLGGASSQSRMEAALSGLEVLWVGVHCDLDIATMREMTRSDRIHGMAKAQSSLVHVGVHYDIEVDTSSLGARDCARTIHAAMAA